MLTKRSLTILGLLVLLTGLFALTFSAGAQAPEGDGPIDCAAYENYAGVEPAGYAENCMSGITPSPWSADLLGPTDTSYVLDYRNGLFGPHPLNNFPAFPGGAVASTLIAFGWEFDETATTLYAVDSATSMLGTVNLATGAFTPLVSLVLPGGDSLTGITIDPRNGDMYASGVQCGEVSNLYSVNAGTGAATLVGAMSGATCVIDLAMDCGGRMFVHDIVSDQIFQVDAATAATTALGPTGVNANFAQGMDFDNDTNTLYIYAYTGGGTNTYGTVNLTTGAIVPLSVDNPLGEFEGTVQTICRAPTDVALTDFGSQDSGRLMNLVWLGIGLVAIAAFLAIGRRRVTG